MNTNVFDTSANQTCDCMWETSLANNGIAQESTVTVKLIKMEKFDFNTLDNKCAKHPKAFHTVSVSEIYWSWKYSPVQVGIP